MERPDGSMISGGWGYGRMGIWEGRDMGGWGYGRVGIWEGRDMGG